MNPFPIPAPVPPAQPTDLDKMVEADKIDLFASQVIGALQPIMGGCGIDQEDAFNAARRVICRHLQPLAEQIAAYRRTGEDINSALNKTGSHGISEVEQIEWLGAELERLQSSAQKGAEVGKWLDAGLTRIYNEVEAYEEAAQHASQSQALANAILPTIRSLLAIVRARSAAPEASP